MAIKKALVTGGAGFIGSHLCETLVNRGWDVTCLDNFSSGRESNVAHIPGLKLISADVNKRATWRKLKEHTFDAVFHYAATVGVKTTEEAPAAVHRDQKGIAHLAAFARAGYAKKIVFASSSEVYGSQLPMQEEAEVAEADRTPYVKVKLLGEKTFAELWRTHRIPTISLRLFNVYGPRQRGTAYGFVVSRFIEQLRQNEVPTVHGDGSQTRDFVFIQDNVDATLAAIEQAAAFGQVLNIGTGIETSITDLARTVITETVAGSSLQPSHEPARNGDIGRRVADTRKLHRLVGTPCTTQLSDGLHQIIHASRSTTDFRTRHYDFLPNHPRRAAVKAL